MALLNICVGVDEMHGIAGAREANITLELGMQVGLRLFNCQNRARNLPRLLRRLSKSCNRSDRNRMLVVPRLASPSGRVLPSLI
jgi:hypothetical protein